MYANTGNSGLAPISVPTLRKMKLAGTPIVMLTAYDASYARVMDAAGVDVVLVGDSLGMVVQGEASTLPVTISDVVYHTRAVRRGLSHALLVADLPFLSYATAERALDAAQRLLGEAGADMLKLEGGGAAVLDVIELLTARDVPVCAHLGLTPQSVLRLGDIVCKDAKRLPASR
jgi:3-methyl-2-oxobutanoate hydroxymethyltransferase